MSDHEDQGSRDGAASESNGSVESIPQVCNLTVDQLRGDKRRLDARCPICQVQVGLHRNPSIEKQEAGNKNKRDKDSDSDESDENDSSVKWKFDKALALVKDIKWLKSSATQTSRTFFTSLEVRLSYYDKFKNTRWVELLPHRMADEKHAL